jgi:hypothetical protein
MIVSFGFVWLCYVSLYCYFMLGFVVLDGFGYFRLEYVRLWQVAEHE